MALDFAWMDKITETTAAEANTGTAPGGSEKPVRPSESSRSSGKTETKDTDDGRSGPAAWLLPAGIFLAGSCAVLIILYSRKKKKR